MTAKTYAHITGGVVREILSVTADVGSLYPPTFVATLVETTTVVPAPAAGWLFSSAGGFTAPVPSVIAKPTVITSLSFLDRLTPAEDLALHTAALSSPQISSYLTRLGAATVVDLKDSRTAASIDALVTAGLLTEDRKVALLTP
jgi:hypothetical protein